MSKEKRLWDIVSEILDTHGDLLDGIHIIEYEDGYGEYIRRMYIKDCDKCYCPEVYKQEADPEGFSRVEDGYVYSFDERWDDFDKAGIDKVIKILNEYAGL